ncbi:hypothetical protein [Vibrio anguillarum]|uniref:Uncharacterized protein n=1 Tax=Vibrio anguillarum TaxID=55601 RepID=A0ABR9Z9H9_VIBAN|nr:hypothetical protein [Vibrio anguillarum]MBF4374380.1 hypothetical protein [Vibrio anguillarum]
MADERDVNKTKESERRFQSVLDDFFKKISPKIRVGYFSFKTPKFWNDEIKLVFVAKWVKSICCALIIIIIGLNATSLLLNDKKYEWNIYTYDQEGTVRWINDIQKIQ